MKLFLVMIMLFSVNAYSQGSPFYTELNGVRYYCKPVSEQPGTGINPYDCIEKAYSGPFSKSESEQLCKDAQTIGPAECAIKVYSGAFSKAESIKLCTGAYSVGPGECAITAYAGPFSKSESLDLCGGRRATIETANCAIRAYAGPYSKAEAIRICKANSKINFSAIAQNSILKNSNYQSSKLNLIKAQEQLKTATEKIQDAKVKAMQNILDIQ